MGRGLNKRRDRFTLAQKVTESADADERIGYSVETRLFTVEAHAMLGYLAKKRDPEIVVGTLPHDRDPNGRFEFTVYKRTGTYFTTDEFTHLADYLRGAADALEALERASLREGTEDGR